MSKEVNTATLSVADINAVAQIKAAIAAGQLKDLAVFTDLDIVRKGKILILPEAMSYDQGIQELQRRKEAEEKIVSISSSITCYPLDGLVAFFKAFQEIYGQQAAQDIDVPTMFGNMKEPPTMIQIPIAGGKFLSVPYGKMAPGLWEGGSLQPEITGSTEIIIQGSIKRKFEASVQEIIKMTKKLLREESIYRGQSVILDYSYLKAGRPFHPVNDAPKFWDVDRITPADLIVNEETLLELQTKIWLRIEQAEACKRRNIPLKAGALFMGSYGTGKTLAAKLTAAKAVASGWTFIYLKDASFTEKALRVAELYAPAVLFAEDIDQATDGDRDGDLNALINTIDGVDTKDKPILSIFTTNHPERINKAFLRAGRIDAVVPFTAPDEVTAPKFVQLYAKDASGDSLLEPETDLAQVGKAIAGMKPAFIANVVQSAKARALYRDPSEPTITTEDLVIAAKAARKHAEMVSEKEPQTDKDKLVEGLGYMAQAMRGNIEFVASNSHTEIE